MTGTRSSPGSTLVDATFHSMEELEEVAHANGWQGQYRQMGKGQVTSRRRWLHLPQSALVSHHLDNRVHGRLTPPSGCVSLGIVPPSYHLLFEGAVFGNNMLLVADTETNLVVPGEARCDYLVVPKHLFEASSRALFPRLSTNQEQAHLIPCPHSSWSVLQVEIRNLLLDGSVTAEDISHLLCRFLDLMAGESGKRMGKRCFGNRSTSHIARLAQEYIEDHYHETFRMEDLCRYTGISLRTLQRSFLVYFQVSPFRYTKALRLNAARQALVAADPSRDQVSRIAFDNGYTHLGRFSLDYRKHFGESPRETLARHWNGLGKKFPAGAFLPGLDTTELSARRMTIPTGSSANVRPPR
ncbi:MAG: AraC family transcriptional regulator [Gammaproteobacteria bacterium]